MADGEGLLAAQQSAAVRIPFENAAMNQQQAGNIGSMFLNAFHAASQANAQRQKLEEQLMKMQFDMSFKEQKHADDMQQMQWMNAYRLSEEQRRSNSAYELADIRERTASLRETIAGNKLDEIKTGTDATAALSDAVSDLRKKYDPGTIEYRSGLDDIIAQNRDAMNTKPGASLVKMYRDEDRQATNRLHQDAVEAHQTFQDNLNAFGKSKEFTLDDFRQKDSVWGRTSDGSRWIAVDSTTKQRLTPKEVEARKSSKGIDFHTLTADQYRIQRKSSDRVNKYLSGDPANLPSVTHGDIPSKQDIEYIKTHPEHAKYFDAHFGEGAAEQWINSQ